MARAGTRTMLPLDRWAYHLGLEPRHFNGVVTDLAPTHSCHAAWLQYPWQGGDRLAREEIAQAVQQAEDDLVEALGFYPVPQWVAGEVKHAARPNDRTLFTGTALQDQRLLFQGIQAGSGMIISGGIRAKTSIGTATVAAPGTMVWTDLDADGYDEVARITLPTTVTSIDEIRCYFPGHSQEDEWEIRPLKAVTISGGNVVIDVDRHLLVDPDLWESIAAESVDGDVDANFLASVEVYRVYNDPSQQAQLQWERVPGECDCGSETCAMCAWQTQAACLQTRNPRLGIVTYQPGTYNLATGGFDTAELALSRAPERVRLWYRAGYQSSRAKRPDVEMDPMFERIITLYSVTLLDRPLCECKSVETFVGRWRMDRAEYHPETGGFRHGKRELDCPWGTREGAIWAWKQAERYALGRAVALA